ncbi:MAG: MMPL family transporter [Clostridia bacterium]|nr:MMPL family transporter [Clostridia bacterium]
MIRHRVIVAVLCIALIAPSILGMAATNTKYDLLYYLPGELETVQGQQILLDDFGVGAFAMVVSEGLTTLQVAELENEIKQVDHVAMVLGYASISGGIPIGLMPEKIQKMFSNGDCMLSFVFFDTGTSAEETMEAVQAVRKLTGEKCFLSGLSAVVTDTKDLIESQEIIYVAIAVALCALVLMITMDSFLLPLIFLFCVGVSVLWNMGSNYFLGEISYITKAVAAVLQLGVTLDYSIFLWHSYREQKALTQNRDEAMVNAIHLTFTSIVGSSLTTVAGFLSLCFMSFTLGKDLGIVMTKGVVLGLIGTVVLLPCMIRLLDGAIDKTSHRPLLPNLNALGRFVSKHSLILFIALLVLIAPAFYGYANAGVYYDMSRVMPEWLPSVQANKKLNENFDMSTSHLMLVDASLSEEDEKRMSDEIRSVDGVNELINRQTIEELGIFKLFLPEEAVNLLESQRYRLMLINSAYVISSDEVNRQIDSLNAILKKYDPDGMLIGEAPCTKDLIACTDTDFKLVSLISIAAIFLIILFVQHSVSIPVLLVAVIELAIALNLCIPYYTGVQLPFVGPILVSTIQLGATVDYAILLTTRYKQKRTGGLKKREAIEQAVSSSAQSIVVSGISFFAATYGVGLYSDIDVISSMCRLIARGSLLSVAVVLLLLPSTLVLLDKLIVRTTLGMKEARTDEASVKDAK